MGHQCEFVPIDEEIIIERGHLRAIRMTGSPRICRICGSRSPNSPIGSRYFVLSRAGKSVYEKEGDRWRVSLA